MRGTPYAANRGTGIVGTTILAQGERSAVCLRRGTSEREAKPPVFPTARDGTNSLGCGSESRRAGEGFVGDGSFFCWLHFVALMCLFRSDLAAYLQSGLFYLNEKGRRKIEERRSSSNRLPPHLCLYAHLLFCQIAQLHVLLRPNV